MKGVDEADIVKTDGQFIYTLSGDRSRYGDSKDKLVVAKAYPSEEAKVLSEADLGNFTP